MPINLPGVPFKLTPQDMGGFDVSDALSKGFNLNKQFQEARTMPRKLAEELLAAQLKNKHDETINKYLDKNQAATLLSKQYSNQINAPYARNADKVYQTEISGKNAVTNNILKDIQSKNLKYEHAKAFQNLMGGNIPENTNSSENTPEPMQNESGYTAPSDLNIANRKGIQDVNDFSDNGMPAGSPGASKSGSAYDTFPGRRGKAANVETWPDKNESSIPSYKETLTRPKKENTELEKMNWIWDNKPQFRKDLKEIGFDKEKSSKSFAPTNTMKEIQAGIDIDSGFVPGTQKSQRFSSPEEQKQYKKAYEHVMKQKEETANAMNAGRLRKATGLKQDEDYIDSKGGVVNNVKDATAIRRPYSEREKKEQSGRRSFNVTYPFILKATSYYSGKGSIKRFNNDIANFDTDEKAQKRIINYLTATQLVSQGTIKETATLGGANTNRVYAKLEKSLNSSDVPIKLEQLEKQFRLPNSANLKSGLKFQELLNQSLKAGESLPSRTTEYLSGDHLGQMYNSKTGKIDNHLVSPDDWEAFKEAGGY